MQIHEYLKKRREELAKRPAQVAREANLSRGFYSQIESGFKTPSLETLFKLADPLDVPFELLVQIAGFHKDWQSARIATVLKALRFALQLTPEEFAERLQLTAEEVKALEGASGTAPLDWQQLLQPLEHITLGQLFQSNSNEHPQQ